MVDLKEESKTPPRVVPCFYGRELALRPEVAMTGLAAIALKAPAARPPALPSVLRARDQRLSKRNSFWDLHRPELSKLAWAADASDHDVREFFHIHSAFQTRRWVRLERDAAAEAEAEARAGAEADADQVRVLLERAGDEQEPPEVPVEQRSVPLTDEDLPPQVRLHRSSGELCVALRGGTCAALRRTASAAEAEAAAAGAPSSAPRSRPPLDADADAPDGEVELRGGRRALLRPDAHPRADADADALADDDDHSERDGVAAGAQMGDATAPAPKGAVPKGDAPKGNAPKGEAAKGEARADADVDLTGDA